MDGDEAKMRECMHEAPHTHSLSHRVTQTGRQVCVIKREPQSYRVDVCA